MKHPTTTQQRDRQPDQKNGPQKVTLAALSHPLRQRSGCYSRGLSSSYMFRALSRSTTRSVAKPLQSVLVIDWKRLPDPVTALAENSFILPRQAVVLIRAAPRPKPLADYIRVVRAARACGYQVFAAVSLRALPTYMISGRHIGEAARCFPAYCGWGFWRGQGAVLTFAVHDRPGLRSAAHWGAKAVFLSPFFATASHPGNPSLTSWQSHDLCRRSRVPVLALGGVNTTTMRRLRDTRIVGLAGLDGWRRQNTLPSNKPQV